MQRFFTYSNTNYKDCDLDITYKILQLKIINMALCTKP